MLLVFYIRIDPHVKLAGKDIQDLPLVGRGLGGWSLGGLGDMGVRLKIEVE